MVITTNPGSNLSPHLVGRYEIEMTPQQIVVDGVQYDTRDGIEQSQIDEWVNHAAEHPYVLGTSAAEYAAYFNGLAASDREILSIQSSRKIIPSCDAAASAVRTLGSRDATRELRIEIVDSTVTDVGAGLTTIYAGEARKAGLSLEQVAEATREFCGGASLVLVPATLDNLVKGGRASFLKAWLAGVLGVRPLLTFEEGELKPTGRLRSKDDRVSAIADKLSAAVGEGRPVWVAVSHGGVLAEATVLAGALARRFDVRVTYALPMCASIYLHAGPGAVAAVVVPIDRLSWRPPDIAAV